MSDAVFLADASRLLAQTLDYEATLAQIAALTLPTLGAWCIVDLVEEDGEIRRLAVVHPDPAQQVRARQLEQGWPPQRTDPIGAPAVMEAGAAVLIPRVDEEFLRHVAHGAENLRLLRVLDFGSLVTVPLRGRSSVRPRSSR